MLSSISIIAIGSNIKKSDNEKVSRNTFSILDYIDIMDLIKGKVYTTCDGVKKITDINFASYNDINVDNDFETGQNGIDISVQYFG